MARERDLEPSPERETIHGGNDGLAQGLYLPKDGLALQSGRVATPRCLLRELFDIGSRNEGFVPRAGHDDGPDGGVLPQRSHCILDLCHRGLVQGIQLLRSVDGQESDGVALF